MNVPQRSAYRTVIVGAGIIGLFTAYHLARAGAGPVLVIDRGFLSSGASGRNGGGVRQQWETPATIRLARESVAAYRRFGRDFGYNVWFRQSGYVFLAENDGQLDRLRRVHFVVRAEGLPSRVIDADEVSRLVPGIRPGAAIGGTYLRSDGTLYPFPALWGLYEAVRRLGVEVVLGVDAAGIDTADGRVAAVRTSAGRIETGQCVNAAGGWSGAFSRGAGLDVPNVATRHEILATEPLKPFLDPMVVRVSDGLYFSQTMRGEIVGGISPSSADARQPGMGTSIDFLAQMARGLTGLFPQFRSLGVLRAWSGFYDDTPDGLPIIGEDARLPGFVHANGFGGHGLMLAPASTREVARAVLGERSDLDPHLFGPLRFLEPGRDLPTERLQLG